MSRKHTLFSCQLCLDHYLLFPSSLNAIIRLIICIEIYMSILLNLSRENWTDCFNIVGERKWYTRQELARHRREGDPDDKSHKGHPQAWSQFFVVSLSKKKKFEDLFSIIELHDWNLWKCKFCDERFLDDHELYRHLRKVHFSCHICEAEDGKREFVKDLKELVRYILTSN